MLAELGEAVWYGTGAGAVAARAALLPISTLYGTAMRARRVMYDRGMLASHALPAPSVSVGNLSVGGTGKTPIAAWLAAELARRGAHPGIVLRGYGGDETLVHQRLNPGFPVVADPDRVEGARHACDLGANVLVLDDAFQHLRARRSRDVVLVSADRWTPDARVLPAGPYREFPGALAAASLLIITRKAADDGRVAAAARWLGQVAPRVAGATVTLRPDRLIGVADAESRPMSYVAGQRVLLISAIGDARAFRAQFEQAGAVVTAASYADHHAFTIGEANALARRAAVLDLAVCTLKDAVKLGPHWPRAASALWYVSQAVAVESGGDAIAHSLDLLLAELDSHPVDPARGRRR